MEEAATSEKVIGVEVLVGVNCCDVGLDEAVFGTSSTIAVGSETRRSTFPSNGRGFNKRRAASIMIHYLGRGGMYNFGSHN